MKFVIGGLKAGTLKDWSERRKYRGVLRYGEEIDWSCEHAHVASYQALECAHAELNRIRNGVQP